jgi:HEAT repeat protein
MLLFTLPFLGLSQPAAPAPRDRVLQNLEEMAFNRNNPEVFLAAKQRLKDQGSNAVPVLIEIFTSQQTQADGWYEKAPEAIRTKATAVQYYKRLQYQAYSGLTDLPETKGYLSSLITLLQDPRKEVRARTAWIISRHSYKADRSLLLMTLPALKDGEAEVRSNMIRVLANATEIPAIKTALEEVLRDSDENVRSFAAYTLLMWADRNHAAALATLVSLFNSTNVHTRYFAAHYYTISSPTRLRLETRLIPIYTNVLAVGTTNLQAMAMNSLSRYGPRAQQVVPQLQEFLTSPYLDLRVAATNALQEIQAGFIPGTPAAPATRELVLQHLSAYYSTNHAIAIQSIKAMGTNAIPFLIEVLGYETTQADQWYEKAYAKAPAGIQSRMAKPEALETLRNQAANLL